ncbi:MULTISPECIES: hypothetical protein [unclassified Bradyrhizobium]|uniref:hypothetical protein n=1 Tax=unclassified Bradyrhizobium TaxID=2631580 RepID=UPI0029169C2A|nr:MULTISPECIES: hypothetical protein [unclassified Bradyrhizobium]
MRNARSRLANIVGDHDHIDPGQCLDRLDVGHVGVEIGEDVEVHVIVIAKG